MNEAVHHFIEKSEIWKDELRALRKILLANGLQEEIKWGKPAYLCSGKIIAVLQPFKKYFALLFYHGHLLKDEKNILLLTGPNTKKGRQLRFENTAEILQYESEIADFINQSKKIISGK